jgi:hypothetical protein
MSLKRFFLQKGICLVIPYNDSDNSNDPLNKDDILKVRYFLSKYYIISEEKSQIYGSHSLCKFIIEEQIKNNEEEILESEFIIEEQIKNNEEQIRNNQKEILECECPICYEHCSTHTLPCKHILCKSCCTKVNCCPLCRSSFSMKSVLVKEEVPKNNKRLQVISENMFYTFCMDRIQHYLSKNISEIFSSIEMEELYLLVSSFKYEIREEHQDILNWIILSGSSYISEIDYIKMSKIRTRIISEDLMKNALNPRRITRFIELGGNIDYF